MTKVILVMMSATLSAFTSILIAGWIVGEFYFMDVVRMLSISLPVFVGWWLAHRGHWRLAGYIPPSVFLLQGLYGTYTFGLITSLLFYVIALLLASMLQGIKAQWYMLVICYVGYLAAGWLHGDRTIDQVVPAAITVGGSLLGITLLQWLFHDQLLRALKQSRAYATELNEQQDHLEELVQARTEELQCEIVERQRAEKALRNAHGELEQRVEERTMALRESEEQYRLLVEHAPAGIYKIDLTNARFTAVNDVMCEYLGYTREEFLALNPLELLTEDSQRRFLGRYAKMADGEDVPDAVEYQIRTKDERVLWVLLNTRITHREGEPIRATVVAYDVTERKRTEELLQALNQAALAMETALTQNEILSAAGEELARLGVTCMVLQTDERKERLHIKHINLDAGLLRAAEKLTGVEHKGFSFLVDDVDVYRQVVRERKTVFVNDTEEIMCQLMPYPIKRFAAQIIRMTNYRKVIFAPLIMSDQVMGVLSVYSDDVTANHKPTITAFAHQMAATWHKTRLMQDLEMSLAELQHTQAQLIQAQKMEAVGRLAGGVAHDFNNLLTVIQVSAQLLERQLRPEDPLWEHVQQIRESGERATGLTRQLLSFSRREIIEPQVLDLNRAIRNLNRVLQRIIGEDVVLSLALSGDLWPVKMDPARIEQMLINLAANARDAMPQGGRLSIETANVTLDAASAVQFLDLQPGEFVLLSLRDTGMGMDDEILSHIFEPFFTTKERGEGTGLGLPTVYGIVKQGGGDISVDSRVGQGTTFKIYLPKAEKSEMFRAVPLRTISTSALRGTETILVVEDKAAVQELTVQILQAHGYNVLAATNGHEALQLCEEYDAPIHLLLTDVVMPAMNGKELFEQLQRKRADVRVLYMSGYSGDVIAQHGLLREGVAILAKPFTLEELTQKVRTVLDGLS
jgi:PAS domain S-box-containing protein